MQHGVNVDSGSYRALNILVVADEEGTGLVLGSLFSSAKEASLEGAEITPHPFDGSEAAAAEVTEAEGEIPTPGGLKLAGVAADANLEAGTTATVTFTFADGATLEVEAPVYSSESASYAQDFTEAVG